MKRLFIGILSLMFFWECDPLVDNKNLGKIVSENDLQLEVESTTPGGNEILMVNNTPNVGSYWDYIIGISTQQRVKAVLPFMGEQTITFTGFCDGGQVTTTRKVKISTIDHEIDREWIYFAGNDISGKHWVWNFEDYDDIVYGTGGWLTEKYPSWDVVERDELEEADCELVFDLDGGPNLTKRNADGEVLEKGRFSFDMSAQKRNPDNGEIWSIGQLKLLGVSVLSGHAFWDEENTITTFEILELTENTMVLCWNPADAEAWTDATFWCFKQKE